MTTSTPPNADIDTGTRSEANTEVQKGTSGAGTQTNGAAAPADDQVAFGMPMNREGGTRTKPSLRTRLASMFRKGDRVTVPAVRDEEEQRREASMAQLKRGFNEAVDTMKVMRSHMEEQARRSERMVELLEGLATMPEATRQQVETLRNLGQTIDAQRDSSDQLTSAVSGLSEATGRQDQALGRLEQRLGTQDEVRRSLDHLAESMADTARTQSAVRDAYREDLEQTRVLFKQGRWTVVVLTVLTTLLAAAALGVAIYALVMLAE